MQGNGHPWSEMHLPQLQQQASRRLEDDEQTPLVPLQQEQQPAPQDQQVPSLANFIYATVQSFSWMMKTRVAPMAHDLSNIMKTLNVYVVLGTPEVEPLLEKLRESVETLCELSHARDYIRECVHDFRELLDGQDFEAEHEAALWLVLEEATEPYARRSQELKVEVETQIRAYRRLVNFQNNLAEDFPHGSLLAKTTISHFRSEDGRCR
jgi:hypothetical protein